MLCCQKSKFFQRCSCRCVLYIDFSWSVAAHFAVSSIAFDVSAPLGCWLLCFVFFYSWQISCEVVFELQLKWADKGPKKSLFSDMVSQRYLALSLLVSIIERNREHGRHPTDCLICGLSISLSVCFSTQRCQGAQNLHWFYGNQWPAIFASLRRSQQFRVHWAGCTCQSTGECSESQIFFFLFRFFWATRDQCLTFSVLQLKLLYSRNSVSSKYFTGSTVQAFRYESHDMTCIACRGGLCQDVCPCCKI